MPTFILRLIAPRPNFAQTLTDSEQEIMDRHAAHWRPFLERGDMVVFGPVLINEDSYGLAVVETWRHPVINVGLPRGDETKRRHAPLAHSETRIAAIGVDAILGNTPGVRSRILSSTCACNAAERSGYRVRAGL